MSDNYKKAYKEVYEILKYIPQEDIEKIPNDLLKTIEKNMDKDYIFNVQEEIKLEEQNLLRETKALLGVIYRDYWATEEEKERITAKEKYDIQLLEEEKRKQYNPDDVFKKIQEESQAPKEENYNINLPIEYNNKPWYIKIFNYLRGLFKKNKINKE